VEWRGSGEEGGGSFAPPLLAGGPTAGGPQSRWFRLRGFGAHGSSPLAERDLPLVMMEPHCHPARPRVPTANAPALANLL